MYSSIWINSAQPDAADIFSRNLRYLLNRVNPRRKPLAFACIGSANVPGDSLGPLMGTILTRHGLPNVYGTMEWPLNALTLPHNMPLLKTVEKKILPHRHRCRHRKSGAKRSSHADRRCTLPRFSPSQTAAARWSAPYNRCL